MRPHVSTVRAECRSTDVRNSDVAPVSPMVPKVRSGIRKAFVRQPLPVCRLCPNAITTEPELVAALRPNPPNLPFGIEASTKGAIQPSTGAERIRPRVRDKNSPRRFRSNSGVTTPGLSRLRRCPSQTSLSPKRRPPKPVDLLPRSETSQKVISTPT